MNIPPLRAERRKCTMGRHRVRTPDCGPSKCGVEASPSVSAQRYRKALLGKYIGRLELPRGEFLLRPPNHVGDSAALVGSALEGLAEGAPARKHGERGDPDGER